MSDDSKPPNEFCALEITYRVESHDMDPDIQFVLLSAYAKLQAKHTDALKLIEEMAVALKDSKQIIRDREKELDSAQYITVAEVECCIDDALESYRKFKGE